AESQHRQRLDLAECGLKGVEEVKGVGEVKEGVFGMSVPFTPPYLLYPLYPLPARSRRVQLAGHLRWVRRRRLAGEVLADVGRGAAVLHRLGLGVGRQRGAPTTSIPRADR